MSTSRGSNFGSTYRQRHPQLVTSFDAKRENKERDRIGEARSLSGSPGEQMLQQQEEFVVVAMAGDSLAYRKRLLSGPARYLMITC
jgi:hypothetical protein